MGEQKTALILLLILICVLVSLPKIGIVKAEPKTIVVPDEYTTIQEAVDIAPEGGTVFVRSGRYEQRMSIDKPLSLIGENPENTIIEEPKIYSGAIIQVDSENVTISGFTIENCTVGIGASWVDAYGPSRCKIIGNRIVNASFIGIAIAGGDHIISRNNITGNDDAIRIGSDDSIISGNIISGNDRGIYVGSGKNLTVYNNTISTNLAGMTLKGAGPFYVYGNNITNNQGFGLLLHGCNNASIYENNIERNGGGIEIANYYYQTIDKAPGSGNIVYQNNFVNNQQQAVVDKTWNIGPWDLTQYYPDAINGTDSASWHKDQVGNYWSNYNGTDKDGNGIGDTPYVIDENNQDNYPLMAPITIFDAGTWEWKQYFVNCISNSTVSDFSFNPDEGALLRFNVDGESGTIGFCRVTIPKDLLNTEGNWVVLADGNSVTPTVNEDLNNTYLYFTYDHTTKTIEIRGTDAIPEFPSWIILPLVLIATLVAIIVKKRLLHPR